MQGYTIHKIYTVICDKCNEDITRPEGGEEPETRQEAEEFIRQHERTYHSPRS